MSMSMTLFKWAEFSLEQRPCLLDLIVTCIFYSVSIKRYDRFRGGGQGNQNFRMTAHLLAGNSRKCTNC